MDYVIGSGPAGVACAQALLGRGRAVTMLDAGLTLEPFREEVRAAMAGVAPEDWTAKQHEVRQMPVGAGVPELKYSHGSDYPYRAPPGAPALDIAAPGVSASFAQGGLSNVWGAAMLPYREADMAGWPVAFADMAQGYRAVLSYVPLAGQADGLEPDWPFYVRPAADMPVSRQAGALLRRLERRRIPGVTAGRARVAVEAKHCIACGECLNGCPRDLIFSTRPELAALRAAGMAYVSGVVVHGVDEDAGGVRIHARAGGEVRVFAGDRVFVAAGVYGTAGLMLRSLGLARAEILDSQYFLLPLLGLARAGGVAAERLHTLAQVFLEIEDVAVDAHNVHLQIYGYSDVLDAAMAQKLGPLRAFRSMLLERMLVVQGYLHSDRSGRLDARLDAGKLIVTPQRNPVTSETLKRVIRKLVKMSPALGVAPVAPLLQEMLPGRGYHSGGSFPMRARPVRGETDALGRPYGRRRVHIVDSSVFPSIPAATITLAVMANAWRIGHES